MDNFYYNLLNIGKADLTKEEYFNKIKNVIDTEAEIYRDDNSRLDRLCIVVSTNINEALKDLNIPSKIVNTKDFFDIYEHRFVLSSYVDDEKINYILIDPTFTQFRHQNNDFHNVYPVDILIETKEGKKLAFNLLKNGYSKIDDRLLNEYIASLYITKKYEKTNKQIEEMMNDIEYKSFNISIDDIMLERRHK